jgi:hypothetical protein
MSADLNILARVKLLRLEKVEAAVAVLVVVPGEKRSQALTGLICGGEGFAEVVRPGFDCH